MAASKLTPDDVREICRQWSSGEAFPASYEERANQLDHLISGSEDMWWAAIEDVVRSGDKDSAIGISVPAEALLRVGGDDWVERLAAVAQADDRFAFVLGEAHPGRWDVGFPRVMLGLVGETRMFRAYCADHEGENWASFWAWNVVDGAGVLGSAEPDWGKEFLLRLVDGVDHECLGFVAAGPVENYVDAYASRDIDWLEAQAHTHPRLREALRQINWSDRHPPVVLERLQNVAFTDDERRG
jgi:hypothetical protein